MITFIGTPQNIATLEFIQQRDADNHRFLYNIAGNWDNHRPMLLLALQLTNGPVIEFGCGAGSTPYLRAYCQQAKRVFATYDSNAHWAQSQGGYVATNWDAPDLYQLCGLAFIDHAPGEHRKHAVERFKAGADVIVVHDAELGGAGAYGLEPVLNTFTYRLNLNQHGGGAGVTAVSNRVDLNQYRGLALGAFKFDHQ